MALYQIEYDIKQIHSLYLSDSGIKGMGDFENIGQYVSVEEGFKHLKDSSKGRLILKKMNIGKFIFDEKRTKEFRQSLPEGMTGIVLKRKFPKVENEAYYVKNIYSVWLNCIKEEIGGEITTRRQNSTKISDRRLPVFSVQRQKRSSLRHVPLRVPIRRSRDT